MHLLFPAATLLGVVSAQTILYDGRAPLNLTQADLEASSGPFLTYATPFFLVLLGS